MPRNWHRYISNMNTDAGRAIVEQGNRIHEARQNLSEKQYLRASLIILGHLEKCLTDGQR